MANPSAMELPFSATKTTRSPAQATAPAGSLVTAMVETPSTVAFPGFHDRPNGSSTGTASCQGFRNRSWDRVGASTMGSPQGRPESADWADVR